MDEGPDSKILEKVFKRYKNSRKTKGISYLIVSARFAVWVKKVGQENEHREKVIKIPGF